MTFSEHFPQINYPAGVFYMDIISELERIGDFIINISQALVKDDIKK